MDFLYKNVEDYLQASGVLEHGTPEAILQARKTYRKLYLAYYKENYSKTHSNVTLSFSKTDKERLRRLAKSKGMRLASFIKEQLFEKLKLDVKQKLSDESLFDIESNISLSLDIIEELLFEDEFPRLTGELKQLERLLNNIKAELEKCL